MIALLARFEPSIFGNPDADLAASFRPRSAGSPTRSATGTASRRRWRPRSSCSAGVRRHGERALDALGSRSAAMPPIMLALWMTESRGGIVAASLAFAVLVAAGPGHGRA